MKKAETKDRIRQAMEIREVKQSDLVERTGIDKGQMSSYLSGKYKPRQKNIDLIAQALSVNEAWLMGFDVPMNREPFEDKNVIIFDAKLDNALDIIKSEGYSWDYTQSSSCDIVIKSQLGKIITCIPDYELVNRYETIKQKDTITAELLLHPFIIYPKEQEHIKKYRFISTHVPEGVNMVDAVLDKTYAIAVQMQEQAEHITQLETKISQKLVPNEDSLLLNAAHERTDCELTAEGQEHDDEIMKDDSEWK